MKNHTLFLWAFVFFVSPVFAQKVVKVRNVDELVKAIASNTVIELEYGLYVLNEHKTTDQSERYGRSGFHFNNISNLTIKCSANFPAELVIDNDEYSTVLRFLNCKNIRLENLEIGHGAARGHCQGAVVGLVNTKNLTIRNCILYGSGTYGIESEAESSDILCEKTTVRSCTYGAITMSNTSNVTFNKVNFVDNIEFDIFSFTNCPNVVFNECVIKDNRANTTDYSSLKLFEVVGSPITLNNCLVKFNKTDFFSGSRGMIINNNSVIESNHYQRKEYEK